MIWSEPCECQPLAAEETARRSAASEGPGGDPRSCRIVADYDVVLVALDSAKDATRGSSPYARLAAPGLWLKNHQAFPQASRCHDKKRETAHAAEQDRPDILRHRQDWFGGQLDRDRPIWAALRRMLHLIVILVVTLTKWRADASNWPHGAVRAIAIPCPTPTHIVARA